MPNLNNKIRYFDAMKNLANVLQFSQSSNNLRLSHQIEKIQKRPKMDQKLDKREKIQWQFEMSQKDPEKSEKRPNIDYSSSVNFT